MFITLLVADFTLFHVSKSFITKEVESGRQTTLQLFANHIEKDIKFGLKSEVYRKCQALFDDKSIQVIKVISADGNIFCDFNRGNIDSDVLTERIYYGVDKNEVVASISLGMDSRYLDEILSNNLKAVVVLFILNLLILVLFARFAIKKFIKPIEALATILAEGQMTSILGFVKLKRSSVIEVDNFYRSIERMSLQIEKAEKENIIREKEKSLYEQANQIVHDLRNPILRLKLKIGNSIRSIEPKNKLLKDIELLEDLTTDMLDRYRSKNKQGGTGLATRSLEINKALSQLINDSKLECNNVNFVLEKNFSYEYLYVGLPRNSFTRVLTNIIKNSADAILTNEGEILVKTSVMNSNLIIEVIDNGKGISKENLDKVTLQGFSFGKDRGNGIGLNFCKEELEKYKGSLDIESELSQFTKVTIKLPLIKVPIWATNTLYLRVNSRLFILDDEEDMHSYWKQLAVREDLDSKGISLIHFYSITEFDTYFKSHDIEENDRFIFDYDLKDENFHKGIEALDKYKLHYQSIVVSNHFDDDELLSFCTTNAVKLYPKQNIDDLELSFLEATKENDRKQVVLIDDDKEILMGLQKMLNDIGAETHVFESYAEVVKELDKFNNETVFFVDLHLSDLEDGLYVTRELSSAGFKNQHLFTGNSIDFGDLPWTQGTISKDSPEKIIDVISKAVPPKN